MQHLLQAIPAQLRDIALQTKRLTVAELLFSGILEAGPGTTQDKEDTLKIVMHTKPAQRGKAYEVLQEWKANQHRLRLLGSSLPDTQIQYNALTTIVKNERDGDEPFKYRLMTYQTRHNLYNGQLQQLDIERFWDYLCSETRDLVRGGSDPTANSMSVKKLTTQWEARIKAVEAKVKKPDKGKSDEKKNTDNTTPGANAMSPVKGAGGKGAGKKGDKGQGS